MGLSLLVALIATPASELAPVIADYQAAWKAAGHPGRGEVRLRLPVYVADTPSQARDDPRPSVLPYYERLRQGYLKSAQGFESADRTTRAAQLATLTYEELLAERVVFGTPKQVTARLCMLQRVLGLAGFIVEPNIGGGIASDLVVRSMDLFTQEVVPRLREGS
jgi:alkanesulfonate monooxygenase SsuD/methylene tetrahydromethanopterin reductase-like flavin-dependent oxidoreductase (luciferase family)